MAILCSINQFIVYPSHHERALQLFGWTHSRMVYYKKKSDLRVNEERLDTDQHEYPYCGICMYTPQMNMRCLAVLQTLFL